MSFPIQSKAELPVYAGDDMAPSMPSAMPKPQSKARRIATEMLTAAVVIFMLGCAWSMYSTATDPGYAEYNSLLAEYKALLRQQTPALGRRAVDANSAALITTTTTVTQGTTVTSEVTASSSASSSSAPLIFTSAPPVQNATMSASVACGTASAETVTVTVTAKHSSSVASDTPFVSFSIFSSIEPTTVVETRVTTNTITVTAGHTTPAPATQTLTATATEGQTSTEIITVHPGGGNRTLTGTSTSTADAVFGTGSHTLRYPNSTISLTPYGTPVNGGGLASTASYTVTVPGGHTGGTVRATTPFYTATSAADPVGTIVTVSGASKTGGTIAIAAAVVAAAAAFASLF